MTPPTWADFKELFVFILPAVALAAGLAVAAGVGGVFVILKRQSLAALAIPQAVAVGVALGLRMNWPTTAPVVAVVALAVLLVALTRSPAHVDALLGALFIGGLCLSVLLVAGAGAHLDEVQKRFVGMDLLIDWPDVRRAGPIFAGLGLLCALLHRRWLLVSQMPAVAELAGVSPRLWHFLFLALLAAIVSVGTYEQGVAMILSLLFLPAAAVLPWARNLPSAMVSAVAVGVVLVLAGASVSILMNWPFGQSVGGVGLILLLLSRTFTLLRA